MRQSRHLNFAWASLLLFALLCSPTWAQDSQIWRVGPERDLKVPSQAAKVARHGDIIEIDAGQYYNDYAVWHQNNLTIRGVGGVAKMGSTRLIPNDKGIWIINGNNTVLDNLEFSGAMVNSTNGAGIRHQGGNLTVRNCFFHHNEFSILSGRNLEAEITISDSRFWFQKRATRFSHGIYIGTAKSLSITGSHFKGTDQGHQIKSRALSNYIAYNRIEDIEIGGSSRLIDLPNCGDSVVLGNELHQGASTYNMEVIGYGAEGCDDRSEQQKVLYVVNNTLVNEAIGGTLVHNFTEDAQAYLYNNLFYGRVWLLRGAGRDKNNVGHRLKARLPGSWGPPQASPAIDSAMTVKRNGSALLAQREFAPPVGTAPRKPNGALDVGAREYRGADR